MNSQIAPLSIERAGGPAEKEPLDTWIERIARKDLAQRILRRIGLDPRQFSIFLGLFRVLSEREELIGSIGVSRFNISFVALLAGVIGAVPWSIFVLHMADTNTPRTPDSGEMLESVFLLLNLFVTFIFVFLVTIREAAIALFNPVEASALAHSPIHGRTYAAAKITHVLIAVLYFVAGLNAYPAFLVVLFLVLAQFGLANLPGAHWYFPFAHLASAFLIGLWTAFMICALYGLIRRILPVFLLRSLSASIHLVTLAAAVVVLSFFPRFFFESFLSGVLTAKFENSPWTWLPLTWFAEVGRLGCTGTSWRLGLHGGLSLIASGLLTWFGLASFSGTYLPDAISSATGHRWIGRKGGVLSRWCDTLTSFAAGSPLGLGVFCFVSKMIRRDWLFRRAILKQTWLPLLVIALVILGIARSGAVPSPVSGSQLAVQVLPHLLGLAALALCMNISYTAFSKSSWIYLTAPIESGCAFAKGVFWALWIPAAGLPHLALLIFLMRFLSWEEAAFVSGFNLIVASLYLAFEIRFISELPFSKPVNESRTMINGIRIQICWLIAIGIPVMVHEFLAKNLLIAVLTAIFLSVIVSLVLRLNLKRLDREILWRLYQMKMGSNQMFREM